MKTNEVKVTQNGGVGFVSLLTILFIALKLMGYITWSWWWVLSPIWITMAFWVSLFIIVFAYYWIADK